MAPEEPAGSSKRQSDKAAASDETNAYSVAYVGASERREKAAGGLFQQPAIRPGSGRESPRSATNDFGRNLPMILH